MSQEICCAVEHWYEVFFKNLWALFICNELVFLHHGVLSNAKHFTFVTVMQTSFPAVFILFCMFTNLNDLAAGQ